MARSLLGCASLLLLGGLFGAGCGGPSASNGCRYDGWEGQCTLRSAQTERIVERFPKSYVIVQAFYEPVSKEGEFSPPPFKKEVMAPAENEQDLLAHLRKYPSVHCVVQDPVATACQPIMSAAVPEFIPPTSVVATVAEGCAKIEQGSGSGDLPANVVSLPGPFQFDDNSATENADDAKLADDAVAAIQKDPRIECVAIKGTSAPGEPFALANDRAQAVRRLLEARGIDHKRVTVFEGTAPAYTATPDDQPVLSEHRRVHLSVVVYSNSQQATK